MDSAMPGKSGQPGLGFQKNTDGWPLADATSMTRTQFPSDWSGEAAVSHVKINLDGEFCRNIATTHDKKLSHGLNYILPVLAYTLATFTNTSVISLHAKTGDEVGTGAQLVYDFELLTTFDEASTYTEAQLLSALAVVSSPFTQRVIAEVTELNGGNAIRFDFQIANGSLTVNIDCEEKILFEGWLRRLFDCFEFYGAQLYGAAKRHHSMINLVPSQQWEAIRNVNDTAVDYPRESDLISVLLASTEGDQKRTAVVSGGREITVDELLGQARAIAYWLTANGDPSGRAVGVVVDRDENAYGVYVGILMAGGYYVPVSTKNPASRIEQIFTDADIYAAIVLDECDGLPAEYCAFDAIPLDAAAQFTPRNRSPDSIAYAIYTSGSTGKPKGVLVTDRNVLRFAVNATHISWQSDDRVGAISSHGFDASTFEIWSALLNSIPIVCMGKEAISDLDVFAKVVSENRVTVMVITSALLTHIVSSKIDALSSLRYLVYGGELTAIETVRRLRKRFPGLELIHAYGPTENTVLSTFHLVEPSPCDRVPIGRPLANSAAWVVDAQFRPLPVGAKGMLVVAGDGVARGYVNRPDATAKHFMVMPEQIRQHEGERGYITGDLVRWNDRFELEFLGRADNQIKIRGHRIELDEIRTILTGLVDVIDAEVVPVAAESGNIIALEAFVVTDLPTTDAIRSQLIEHLPDYMIPRTFHKIASLPFNASGKVDRQALELMRSTTSLVDLTDGRDDNDRRLLAIWKKLFGVTSLAIDDSYTSLGGHSMMMLEMADMVFDEFGLDIALSDLMVLTTIREISDALAQQQLAVGRH